MTTARGVMHPGCAYVGMHETVTDAAWPSAEARAGDLIDEPHLWWIDADAGIDEVLHEMAKHKIRRLPVLENKELVGIISQADLAVKLPRDKSGELLEAISSTSQ
jgi:CBS domain-containing protein